MEELTEETMRQASIPTYNGEGFITELCVGFE